MAAEAKPMVADERHGDRRHPTNDVRRQRPRSGVLDERDHHSPMHKSGSAANGQEPRRGGERQWTNTHLPFSPLTVSLIHIFERKEVFAASAKYRPASTVRFVLVNAGRLESQRLKKSMASGGRPCET